MLLPLSHIRFVGISTELYNSDAYLLCSQLFPMQNTETYHNQIMCVGYAHTSAH